MHKDWTIREKDGVAIIRVEGNDYVEISGTSETYPAAYPDSVANAVLERGENKIKVVLGHIRYMLNEDGEINEVKSTPQMVWLSPISEDTKLEASEEESDGFITG